MIAGGGGAIPRQAMVLAAGRGERMRPLTASRAKPSLPLMNRALILHVLDLLARHGVRKAAVNLHHHSASLAAEIEGGAPPGLAVAFSREPEILGTAGGIRAALAHFDETAPLLVLNADSLCDADLAALASAHEEASSSAGAPATLAVRARQDGEPYAPVHLDGQGRVAGIGGSGEEGEAVTFIGLHILSPEAIARIPEGRPSDIVRDVYQPLLREGRRLGAHRHRGWWVEIGSPALYLKAHLTLLAEAGFTSRLPASAGSMRPGARPSLVGPGSLGLEQARAENAVLGPGCLIGEGAEISDSVLGAGVVVGVGAQIEGSIVWEGVEVMEGTVIRSSLAVPPEQGSRTPERLSLR